MDAAAAFFDLKLLSVIRRGEAVRPGSGNWESSRSTAKPHNVALLQPGTGVRRSP